ncbi:tyrosine-type recombinase/integrase [Salibaculum griseiflavum]|uniref:Integrase n=1 Tax=Salibaculum griseiflavum TaxID=1914409 RepID=A0A2V1P2A6_9RHOB|nr:integrase arm-type DNA-binding domain-containing protein [Salibaculum griseiflavum]PWG16651.1 integrase [Salibaculum griseiflavum]
MLLTDSKIRAAKPAERTYRIADGHGLYLEVLPSGTKTFRLRYYFPAGKRRWSNLGPYPQVKLADARGQRDRYRETIRQGEDPEPERKPRRAPAQASPKPPTLGPAVRDPGLVATVCDHYLLFRKRDGANQRTLVKLERHLETVKAGIGDRQITDISGPDILALVRPIEEAGKVETAHEVRSRCSQLFRFAIAEGRATADPARAVTFAMAKRKRGSFQAITDPERVGAMLKAIRRTDRATDQVKTALLLSAYLFPRSSELRGMRWNEIDWNAGLWEIPAERMKMKRPHLVPLSPQAKAILEGIRPITGHAELVLCSPNDSSRPISSTIMKTCLTKVGFSDHTQHGFRTTFSTNMNEMGWNSDWIEKQLAHETTQKVRAAYNRAEYLADRIRMVHAYGEWLTKLEKS